MTQVSYSLFGAGILAYLVAVFGVGTVAGEVASDVGTALMLILCGITALRFSRQIDAKGAAPAEAETP